MPENKPKLGKPGGLKEIAKKLTELRKKPVSKEVLNIVEENYRKDQKKKVNRY